LIKPSNLLKHEFIGLTIKVVESNNQTLVGIIGKVVDETQNLFIIETEKGEKEILKKDCLFEVQVGKEWVQIDGKLLVGKPEARIKFKSPKERV